MLNFTPVGATVLILYLLVAAGMTIKKRMPVKLHLLTTVFVVYALAVIKITLFPIPLHTLGSLPQNNLIPFHTIRGVLSQGSLSYDLYNLGGNVLLFIPLGFFLPLLFPQQNRLWRTVLVGFCGSFLIESGKFIISSILGFTYRNFDVDDLILNTFGAFFGYVVLWLGTRLQVSQTFRTRRAWYVASPILCLVVLGAMWGYEYGSHSTPSRAQRSYDSNVLPLTSIPLSKGVVLITATDPLRTNKTGYVAWYWEKTKWWGWRLKDHSFNTLGIHHDTEASLTVMTANGQTLVWGVVMNASVKDIIYHENGQIYRSQISTMPFWHIILPIEQKRVVPSSWKVQLRNGHTVALF